VSGDCKCCSQSINQSINLYRAIVQRRVLQCGYAESKRNVLIWILNVLTDVLLLPSPAEPNPLTGSQGPLCGWVKKGEKGKNERDGGWEKNTPPPK